MRGLSLRKTPARWRTRSARIWSLSEQLLHPDRLREGRGSDSHDHTLLGEENFQKGMQLYFERHMAARQPATTLFRRWKMRRMSSLSFPPLVQPVRYAGCDRQNDYNPETEQYTLTISQRTPARRIRQKNSRCIFRLPSNCMTRRQSDPVAERRSPGEFGAELTQAEQTFVFDNVYFQPVPACCANSLRQ